VSVNELGLRNKLDEEIERFHKFQGHVFQTITKTKLESADVDVRAYAKYVLREGSVSEKRELLGNLRSRLVYQNKRVNLLEEHTDKTNTPYERK
jgi:hypothetical protein